LGFRNALQINPKNWDDTVTCIRKKWAPEQIAVQVCISHKRFTAKCLLIKLLAVVFVSSCVAKRNPRSAMPLAMTGGAIFSIEGPLASVLPILNKNPK
jgi:hypothetical protein